MPTGGAQRPYRNYSSWGEYSSPEVNPKSLVPILRYLGWHFGFQIFVRYIVSRYMPIFEGSFSKSYSFYYIKKISRFTKTALTPQILSGWIFWEFHDVRLDFLRIFGVKSQNRDFFFFLTIRNVGADLKFNEFSSKNPIFWVCFGCQWWFESWKIKKNEKKMFRGVFFTLNYIYVKYRVILFSGNQFLSIWLFFVTHQIVKIDGVFWLKNTPLILGGRNFKSAQTFWMVRKKKKSRFWDFIQKMRRKFRRRSWNSQNIDPGSIWRVRAVFVNLDIFFI